MTRGILVEFSVFNSGQTLWVRQAEREKGHVWCEATLFKKEEIQPCKPADTLCRDGLQTGQGESTALPREPPLDVRLGGATRPSTIGVRGDRKQLRSWKIPTKLHFFEAIIRGFTISGTIMVTHSQCGGNLDGLGHVTALISTSRTQ